ncbi:uncharacterized protein LOC110052434 [Orbicella faveolata]|uniref:uncharacterized protein LOC110052434 n=1 Tax=Orbicella faveolata TaxID=48498 RepID=UPI0009E3CB60|nr:uncharacterized protein LOC110052434 [Orbicella faveolata]
MWILPFLLFLVALSGSASNHDLCDKDKGPTGIIKCSNFEGYQGEYQWATCLTSDHILEKDGRDHICADRTGRYCWHKCMSEVHRQSFGNVSDDCACDPFQLLHNTSLPQQCYSPAGDSCYWYRNCLEKKHFCKPPSNAYVVRYAERFCRVFEEQKAKLSADAQKWMEAVRKCQQVAMVPLLRDSEALTCNEIKEKALASYTQCYLNPGEGAKSICDVHCWQHFKIFWAIKGSFLKLDTAWESLKGLWNIGAQCSSPNSQMDCFERNFKNVIKLLKLNVENLMRRKRRSPDSLSNVDILSRFTNGVGEAIASKLKWNRDVMDWVAYTSNWVSLGNVDIIIAMADRKALGIVTAPVESVNLEQTIDDFVSAINTSSLRPQVDGYNVWIKSLALCIDKSCVQTRTLTVSNKPPWSGATRISHGTVGVFAVIAMLIMLIDKLLC